MTGVRINDSRPVAVKFIESSNIAYAEHEYRIYSYLHAIDNPTVERFGIPAVYYYGKWKDFIVIAITLCERGSLNDYCDDFDPENPLNNLIVFREFVSFTRQISHTISHFVIHSILFIRIKYSHTRTPRCVNQNIFIAVAFDTMTSNHKISCWDYTKVS